MHVLPDDPGGAVVGAVGERKLAYEMAAALNDIQSGYRIFGPSASLSSSAIAIDHDHGELIGFRSLRPVARHGSGCLRSAYNLLDAWYAQEQKTVGRPISWP